MQNRRFEAHKHKTLIFHHIIIYFLCILCFFCCSKTKEIITNHPLKNPQFTIPKSKQLAAHKIRKKKASINGVSLGLFAQEANYNYQHFLKEIKEHAATDVLLVSSWYQDHVFSTDISPRIHYSPSTQNIGRTIKQAQQLGLRVSFMPIIRLKNRQNGDWRGNIWPKKGIDLWFKNYTHYILQMAKLAEKHHIDSFSVGSELLSLESFAAKWHTLIQQIRIIYRGKIFYSANWDHYQKLSFMADLDFLGLTAYYELCANTETCDAKDWNEVWKKQKLKLAAFKSKIQKNIIFTEIGYPSIDSAARYPWDETRKAEKNQLLQAALYTNFCQNWQDSKVINGFYFWNWFGFGGADDLSYTPRAKPAAKIMQQCLKQWRTAVNPNPNK